MRKSLVRPKVPHSLIWRAIPVLTLLWSATPGLAQIVPVKTVPVASGDQFLLFPSTNLAMGEVSIALTDTLGDPFVNPALGGRLRESVFFGSPTFYDISEGNGAGRTLPLGTLFRSGAWFGGGALSIQEVEGTERNEWIRRPWIWGPPQPRTLSEGSARNLYAFGFLGRRFPQHSLSIGVSGSWADLGAVDGVDLLYATSDQIEQSGHLSDLRLGILKEWEGGQALELLVLRSKLRMQHDVSYSDLVWEPVLPDTIPQPQWRTRLEENFDYTDTWGAHLAYRRPLSADGWTMGWSLTGNWKDHPKIPNYEIQNIPRDPGNTEAYGLGIGLSKIEGPTRFAADLILEPIRSETWADAASDTLSVTGETIPAGEKTVENEFRFTNALVRAGGSWDYRWVTFRGGIQVRSISYELDQFNRIEDIKRDQRESWMEWLPSLGASLNLDAATIHYSLRLTTGTGRPGTGAQWNDERMVALAASDFLLAPSGPLTLQDARVTTHQLSVVVPIR